MTRSNPDGETYVLCWGASTQGQRGKATRVLLGLYNTRCSTRSLRSFHGWNMITSRVHPMHSIALNIKDTCHKDSNISLSAGGAEVLTLWYTKNGYPGFITQIQPFEALLTAQPRRYWNPTVLDSHRVGCRDCRDPLTRLGDSRGAIHGQHVHAARA